MVQACWKWVEMINIKVLKDKSGKIKNKAMFSKIDYTLAPIPQEVVWDGVLQADSIWCNPKESSLKLKMKDMVGGWFIGDFEPCALKDKRFEVAYKYHKKDEKWPTHYHKEATEINYMISGRMTIQGKLMEEGDIFYY